MQPDITMFANRVKKNLRRLSSWKKKYHITCYRLYDRDLPEFAVALDCYEHWVQVQEYQAPPSVSPEKARERLRLILDGLPEILNLPAENIILKVRKRQKGMSQYEKLGTQSTFFPVQEGGCRFLVNLTDYLDTGIFLDHRITRSMVRDLAQEKRFLNLFSYTGTVSVYAVKGGASQVTTVDMSRTYLDWAKRNFELNQFDPHAYLFEHADCIDWLSKCRQEFDLIFLDPPTFSNSKRMTHVFDIQRDHVHLLQLVMKVLAPEGILIFSNNLRSFQMEFSRLSDFNFEDWTTRTLPKDFERNPKIHQCWKITHRPEQLHS